MATRLPKDGLGRPVIDIDPDVTPFRRGAAPRIDPLDGNLDALLEKNPQLAQDLVQQRLLAATHFSDRLGQLIADPAFDIGTTKAPTVPGQLSGVLQQPNGLPAARVQVTITRPFPGGPGAGTAVTGTDGSFTIAVPQAVRSVENLESLALKVTGGTRSAELEIALADLDATGSAGVLALSGAVDPLPLSVISQLGAVVGGLDGNLPGVPPEPGPEASRAVALGVDAAAQVFRTDLSVDRFPYGVLVRLVEPRPSVGSLGVVLGDDNHRVRVSAAYLQTLNAADHPYRHVERLPIDQPVNVDAFRDGVAGITPGGFGSDAATVPIAGTLGLGYIVHMAQTWTPKALALGDLVYSLPLAPGEQQRIAIVDRRATSTVSESERLDVQEAQSFRERDDASTRATFESGMSQQASGGSSFSTEAHSSSWGAAGGIGFALGPIAIGGGAAGGSGSSDSSGETNNWMQGVSNYASNAAQASHASVERAANANRSLQRLSVRLAAASERTEVVTKVIANHNRTRALTMQYWEVLRIFDVRSAVEGTTLVCFVPLDPVRFLPAGEPTVLGGASLDRTSVLRRYEQLLNYAAILRRSVERPYRKGLAVLEEFAADPRATVQSPTDSAADMVTVSLTGTFLPYDDVRVTLLATGGRRLGPYPVPTSGIPGLPDGTDPTTALASEAEIIGALRDRRDGSPATISRSIMLPEWLPRTDVVGVELTRQFRGVQRHFASSVASEASRLAQGGVAFEGLLETLASRVIPARDVWFAPDRLEREVGGPHLDNVKAAIIEPSTGGTGPTLLDEALGGAEFTPAPLPFPATMLPPELAYTALLEIEKTLQHVVSNTVTYSKAVWMSLTSEERVMLLEGYTIGVAGGVEDDTQDIPLLACVANQLLGFYGNSMVLPFMIPAQLVAKREPVDGVPFTTASVQDALTRYHTAGFSPPTSTIALPTQGVLGEAVLGSQPSAEKIDLTRFWNWQDSPMDEAPDIAGVTVPDGSLTAGLQAPNTLTGVSPAIQISTQGPAADFGVLGDLVKAAAEAKGFDVASLTGSEALAQLITESLKTAESARKDALAGATSMAKTAMESIPNVITAKAAAAAAGKKDDAAKKPTVTKLEPVKGKVAAALVITGTGFTEVQKVTVGEKDLAEQKVESDTKITGKVPSGLAPGAVDVVVTTKAGASEKSDKSKFTVEA
ncbi:IPT/TIG domain-containing protein [Nocardioides terrae]|uniref:IPT/TIG domain-containing protein n=1 Tax=Nocardioides terrae TaxID=574651 RepID=A0A1I1I2M3_9ACTN|nr:IPT/TIG domain-containing protein [Nocardioides terrae]SFC30454.1 IPT/TIG domain-containing protein [Nocardioides terrae]